MVSPLYYLLCNFFLGIQALKCYYIAGWQVRTIQLDNLSLFYWVVKSEFSFSSWVFEWYLCFQIDFQSQCLLSHILKCQRINLHSLREEVAVLTVASLAWTRLLGSEIGEQQGTKKWSRGGGGGRSNFSGRPKCKNSNHYETLNNKRASLSFQTLPLSFVLSCYLQAIETSILNVNSNSFPGLLIIGNPVPGLRLY